VEHLDHILALAHALTSLSSFLCAFLYGRGCRMIAAASGINAVRIGYAT